MEDANIRTSGEGQSSCPICQDLLKNPVTCNCGQSLCSACVDGKCLQCGETFSTKPVSRVDEFLRRMDKLESSSSNDPSDPSYAGPGDVKCDECTAIKRKAVKSCVTCMASFCESHLIPHTTVTFLKRHKLIEASSDLQENICFQHNKLKEFYCRTDQNCICASCVLIEHKGHNIVEAETEKADKKNEVEEKRSKVQQNIRDKQNELEELKKALDSLKCSAQAAIEENEKIFTQLIQSIEKTRSEVAELIRAQEKTKCSRITQLQEQLQQEIADLHRRDTELEKLLITDNNIYFLQHFQCLSSLSASLNSISFDTHLVKKSLSEIQNPKFQIPFENDENKIFSNAINFHLRFPSEARTNKDFLQYFRRFTLDTTTANSELDISENHKEARCRGRIRRYNQHPDRFDFWPQVLCKEGISGHCYWEVEWEKGIGGVYIAVSYKSAGRKGEDRALWFGHNSHSWSLECSATPGVWHKNAKTEISGPLSSKIGVYVDYNAGILSFYDVSDAMRLLHRFKNTFTQPLHPGFWISFSSSITLCDLQHE